MRECQAGGRRRWSSSPSENRRTNRSELVKGFRVMCRKTRIVAGKNSFPYMFLTVRGEPRRRIEARCFPHPRRNYRPPGRSHRPARTARWLRSEGAIPLVKAAHLRNAPLKELGAVRRECQASPPHCYIPKLRAETLWKVLDAKRASLTIVGERRVCSRIIGLLRVAKDRRAIQIDALLSASFHPSPVPPNQLDLSLSPNRGAV